MQMHNFHKINLKEIVVILRSEVIGENDEAVFIEPRSDIPPPSRNKWLINRVLRFAETWEEDAREQMNLLRRQAKVWQEYVWEKRFYRKCYLLLFWSYLYTKKSTAHMDTDSIERYGQDLSNRTVPEIKYRELVTVSVIETVTWQIARENGHFGFGNE
jgi:hypothetical protein